MSASDGRRNFGFPGEPLKSREVSVRAIWSVAIAFLAAFPALWFVVHVADAIAKAVAQ